MVASGRRVFPPLLAPAIFRVRSSYHAAMRAFAYAMLAVAILAGGCTGKKPPSASTDETAALDAVDLEARLSAGSLSAEHVARVFLDRIAALNDAGPELHAIIEVNPDALSIARDLDVRRAQGGPIGPLH